MTTQTERELKFLIDPSKLPLLGEPALIQQSYLSYTPVIRIRQTYSHGRSTYDLTIKVRQGGGEAIELVMDLESSTFQKLEETALSSISKERFYWGEWEIDHFEHGLWMAERELFHPNEDISTISLPDWVTREVTYNPDFTNEFIARNLHVSE